MKEDGIGVTTVSLTFLYQKLFLRKEYVFEKYHHFDFDEPVV